jgi:uncharacterized membrane protein YhhN
LPFHPYALSYLLKAVPVLTLGLLAFSGVGGLSAKQKALFVCAMLGAAGGDIFLDLDRTLNLKPALACFLVTQVAYIALFVPLRDTTSWRRWLMMPIGLMALGLVYLFSKTAGPLFIPVLVYVIVLCGMAFSALLVANNHWVNIGGILFLIADALIGINRFILPFDYSTNIIVSIYITSQLCIGWGLLFYKNAVKTRQESSSL